MKGDLLECYVSWREECEAVRTAYDDWRGADKADRQGAFFAYHAALDREESAARDYREIAERARLPARALAWS